MARISRVISVLLTAVFLFTFAACKKAEPEPETTTKTGKSAEKNTVVTLPLAYEPLETDEEEFEDGESKWQHVLIGFASVEREYPALAASLGKLNNELDAEAAASLEQIKTEAEETKAKYGISFFPGELYSRRKLIARRADSNYLSLVQIFDSYSGGDHPSTQIKTFNFDSKTGKQLLTDDVFTNFEVFIPKLSKSVKAAYPDADWNGENLTALIKALYHDGNLYFSIDYEGITFYFGTDELASYQDGILAVSFTYDKLKSDVVSKYAEIPETYSYAFTVDIPNYRGVICETDLKNLLGYTQGITLKYDDSEQKLKDLICGNYALYFVHMGQSGDYIYLDHDGEDGYGGLYIFSIGAKNLYETKYLEKVSLFATELGDSSPCYAEMFTCPSRFILGTRCDLLATSVAKNKYQVGKDGIPKLLNKEAMYLIDSTRQYKLREDIRDEDGVLIKSGTKFNFTQTDFGDKAVFITEDGMEHTVNMSEIN
ncbi:MAG: hypothetical protein IKT04_04980, partial [Clostridia bacterium]|nr:hypothetical protein [Clostridia bacterium]